MLEETIGKQFAAIVKDQFAQLEKRIVALEIRPPGRDGQPGVPGRDGKDGAPGAPGKDGKDGVSFDNVTFQMSDDGRFVIERYERGGELIKEFKRPARGVWAGPWKHDGQYFLDDMVAYDNCAWVAITKLPKSRPGVGYDWQLFVRKGAKGKDGERGPAGPAGPPGKDASY